MPRSKVKKTALSTETLHFVEIEKMALPTGRIANYFQLSRRVSRALDWSLALELLRTTRHLIQPFLTNTEFLLGRLDVSVLHEVPLHTIFARRERGNVPYLLSDLASDLRDGTVSRLAIDTKTEEDIRSLASLTDSFPLTPLPVIVEDCTGKHCLILEGNKRFTALCLTDCAASIATLEIYVGHTTMTWSNMLAQFNMKEAA
jgi:hypothetical protein